MYFIFTDENYRPETWGRNFITGLNINKSDSDLRLYILDKLTFNKTIYDDLARFGYCYLRIVNLQNNDRIMKYPHGYKGSSLISMFTFLSNNVILSDRYYLYDPKTIRKFNIKIDKDYITGACIMRDVKFLEWWKNSGLPLKYDEDLLGWISNDGRVDVLTWWLNSGLPLKYDEYVLDRASECGHMEVLKCWFNSGLPLKYSEEALG